MFIQVISAKVRDRDGVRRFGERWNAEIRPGAAGFLGATFGVTDDGTLVNCARFESREAAAANSSRPEQSAWWGEFEQLLDGPATFRESDDVTVSMIGDVDSARFVQVMEGRLLDVEAARALGDEMNTTLAVERPDILGDVQVIYPDGAFTNVVYFVSEAAARDGESKNLSPAAQGVMDRMMAVMEVHEFLDVRDPVLI